MVEIETSSDFGKTWNTVSNAKVRVRATLTKPKSTTRRHMKMPRPAYPPWECTTLVKKGKKIMRVLLTLPTEDGTLVGGCYNCIKNKEVDIARFAPYGDSSRTNGKRQRFDAALAAFYAAREDGDVVEERKQRTIVEALRTQKCDTCCERDRKLSPAQQACKDEWARMRQDVYRGDQNGCANEKCLERGMASWVALQADHGTNPKRYKLGDYMWWSARGGVAAMQEEAKRIHQWVCGTCHAVEPTGHAGKEHDPKKMKQRENETTGAFNTRRSHAEIRFPKYEHVNERKRFIKTCQYEKCTTECVKGNEVGFHWDHRVEGTKRKCRCLNAKGEAKGGCRGCADKLFGRNGGVAGLANNHTNASALKHTKGLLDAEMDKCDLLCSACHLNRKPHKRGRWDDSLSAEPEVVETVEAVEEQLETESESDSDA